MVARSTFSRWLDRRKPMVRLGLVVHQAKVIPRQFDPACRGLGSELLELGEDGLDDPDHNCERWCRADVLIGMMTTWSASAFRGDECKAVRTAMVVPYFLPRLVSPRKARVRRHTLRTIRQSRSSTWETMTACDAAGPTASWTS